MELANNPPHDQWHDWTELDAKAWPDRVERHYTLVPTTCFNCEAACGLTAYVDRDTGEITKFEGNPEHPASRGRNCAKGPATLNQVHDPERVLHPLKRAGERGAGSWERVTWDQALDEIGARIRRAFEEGRRNEVMYHVGRPGEDGYTDRVLKAWNVDGHNSHTNICSSNARIGYQSWMGHDRPSSDFANAEVIFLISSHLEAGHYFNPHAQRIMEAKAKGATVICVDPAAVEHRRQGRLLVGAVAGHRAGDAAGDRPPADRSTARGSASSCAAGSTGRRSSPRSDPTCRSVFESVEQALLDHYAEFTIERAERVCGVAGDTLRTIAGIIGRHPTKLASHTWRAAGAGNLGGWQVARCLFFLNVLTGSVGTEGGTNGNGWNKFVADPFKPAPPVDSWNELTWPIEYPLAYHEMSMLLPHFLLDGRGKLDTYFSRVYNPVWTNPDGFSWLEALKDETRIECHVALTPTWSETAWFADYVLPMGVGAERHDIASFETHAGRWIGFRQPVLRRYAELNGEAVGPERRTHEFNPGEVWEENEFWIDLSWRIDPDGSLGIRQWFESDDHPGTPVGVDEYYGRVFTDGVPGLAEAAAAAGVTPLEFMRDRGAYAVPGDTYLPYERIVAAADVAGCAPDDAGVYRRAGTAGTWDQQRRSTRHDEARRSWRRVAGGRRRRRGEGRLPDAVEEARVVLDDVARLGLARARDAGLDPVARALGGTRPGG